MNKQIEAGSLTQFLAMKQIEEKSFNEIQDLLRDNMRFIFVSLDKKNCGPERNNLILAGSNEGTGIFVSPLMNKNLI